MFVPYDIFWSREEDIGYTDAASLILHHQATRPLEPPLFRSAIFLCGLLPWTADELHGIDVTPLIVLHRAIPYDLIDIKHDVEAASEEAKHRLPSSYGSLIPPALRDLAKQHEGGAFEYDKYITRKYHPDVDDIRIDIPTGHVVGKRDDMRAFGRKLFELCREDRATLFEHNAGHEIPASPAVSRRIADLIEKTVTRSEFL